MFVIIQHFAKFEYYQLIVVNMLNIRRKTDTQYIQVAKLPEEIDVESGSTVQQMSQVFSERLGV